MKKIILSALSILALAIAPAISMAQSYTVNFTATPPTADGVVSAGEWAAAAPAITQFTAHDSATPSDPAEPTSVRVLYSVDAIYVLFECTDTLVESVTVGSERRASYPDGVEGKLTPGEANWTFGGTDYLAMYLDPSNTPDDFALQDPSKYSYSIQVEPSITANNEKDEMGRSYNYSELGRFGGFRARNVVTTEAPYWVGGLGWDVDNSTFIDGPVAGGYVMECRIPWSDLNVPYNEFAAEIIDNDALLDAVDVTVRDFPESVWGIVARDGGNVSGMPLPGTTWKAQFCRHSNSAAVTYINWVGDTGGFVSRPFGDIVFGDAPASAVLEALLHQN